MKLNISDRKNLADNGFLTRAEKKIKKLDRYFDQDCVTDVKLSSERGVNVVEVTVSGASGSFRAQERSENSYLALDNAVDAIDRQIRKYRTRLEKRLRENAFERSVPEGEEISEEGIRIVRKKKILCQSMTQEEAVLQMEMLGHSFFVFRNGESDNRISIVYRRTGGDHGLIEVE